QSVRNASGGSSPKYVIANRALISIARELQRFATNSATGSARKIEAGLFIFSGDSATAAVQFGPFNAAPFEDWAKSFSNPGGNTPLGNSLNVAARAVLNSPLTRKHVLIITDGENTTGPTPASVMPRLKKQAEEKHSVLS